VRKMIKFLMLILSYSPIASVAVAAQAKANEIEGESQSYKVQQVIREARSRLIPFGQASVSLEEARDLYSKKTGLQGDELETNMQSDLNFLKNSGLIVVSEKAIVSSGPSEH
jgi:hypothetical protein